MWSRAQLKDKAKAAFRKNYWKVVLVSAILLLLGSGGSTGFNYTQSYTENNYNNDSYGGVDDYYYDDYDIDNFYGDDYLFEGMDALAIASFAMVILIIVVVVFLIALVIAFVLQAFIFNPIEVGCKRFYFKNLNEKANVKEVAYAFDTNYKNVVKTMFFRSLYTFLWSMLFVIPGIVKGYEYRMIPYLLAENPSLSKEQAFAISKQMMDGQKWDTFVLDLSFFGWNILSGFTMGILGIFYVTPYRNMTDAALYESLCYQRQWTSYNQPNVGNAPYYVQQPVKQTVPEVEKVNLENAETEDIEK